MEPVELCLEKKLALWANTSPFISDLCLRNWGVISQGPTAWNYKDLSVSVHTQLKTCRAFPKTEATLELTPVFCHYHSKTAVLKECEKQKCKYAKVGVCPELWKAAKKEPWGGKKVRLMMLTSEKMAKCRVGCEHALLHDQPLCSCTVPPF